MQNDLPNDAVEMIREIRNRKYEERKHMTREEIWACERKSMDDLKRLAKEVNPDHYDFSWLRKK